MKSQDVLVALSLFSHPSRCTYAERAAHLGMSASEVHSATSRLEEARLLDPDTLTVRREPFLRFLVHGVPYAFAVAAKELTRGMPTAWAGPVLAARMSESGEMPPVWPDPEGSIQGQAIKPLYRSVPEVARKDRELYELLSLVDAIRIGRARERKMAEDELNARLNQKK